MPRSARPIAAVSMKEWVMPAPAPWANTKQARASFGATSNAETEVDLPTSMTSFCGLFPFIAPRKSVIGLGANDRPKIFQHLPQHCDDVAPARLGAISAELSFQRELCKSVHGGPGQ